MEITHRRLPRVDVLSLSGRMSALEAQQLQARVDELLKEGRNHLILDVTNLEFMSSSELRVVSESKRCEQKASTLGRRAGDVRIAGATPYITDRFARTGFTSYFTVYDDLVEAVANF